jgi:hypothetical protein
VHRPSANGRCEQSHLTISACLAKLVSLNQTDWDEHLPMVTFAMNCAKNEATTYAPFQLMFARLPRMPVEMVMDLPADAYPSDLDEYVADLSERTREANRLVQKHMRATFSRMKRRYDARVHEKAYKVGQFVLFYYPRRYRLRTPKLSRPNIEPFCILRKLNAVNYIIAMTPRSRRIVAHVDKLTLWHGDPPKCWENVEQSAIKASPAGTPDSIDEDAPYIADPEDADKAESAAHETSGSSRIPILTDATLARRNTELRHQDEHGRTGRPSKLPMPVRATDPVKHAEMDGSQSTVEPTAEVEAGTPRIGRPSRNIRLPARYRN